MAGIEKPASETGTPLGSTPADWLRRFAERRRQRQVERAEQAGPAIGVVSIAGTDLAAEPGQVRAVVPMEDDRRVPTTNPALTDGKYTPIPPGQPYAEAVTRAGRVVVGQDALQVLFDRHGNTRR